MDSRIVLAFANKSTDYRWTLYCTFYMSEMECAKNTARRYSTTDMANSAIGIFIDRTDGIHFAEKKPRYVYNGFVLVEGAKIGSALSGLINSRESDWF